MEKTIIPWNEIVALLKEEANVRQKEVIEIWLGESVENQKVFDEIINSWQLTKAEVRFYEPDKKLLWKRLLQRINYQGGKLNIGMVKNWWYAAAAILIIVFITGVWIGGSELFNPYANQQFSTVVAPLGSKTQIVLPDETKVWLNSGSELKYPQQFSKADREVYITGECYFDVMPNKKSPFIVHTSDIDVKVLGTKFNVKDNSKDNLAEVILVSGKVQVMNNKNELVANLTPNQRLTFSNGLGMVAEVDNVEALTSWINNMLVFENLPFEDVTKYLENWYGVRIHLDSSIYSNHRYTFKVKTESLREVLELISVITPIEYKIEGEEVSIKYEEN